MSLSACILVVDDSPTARRTTSSMLVEAGYEVVTADDGDDALRLYEYHQPDAVVLDVILPKKNGFQVCRQLKNKQDHLARVLLLTCKTHQSDQEWGLRQGADGYLTKPFKADELLDSLERLLVPTTGG